MKQSRKQLNIYLPKTLYFEGFLFFNSNPTGFSLFLLSCFFYFYQHFWWTGGPPKRLPGMPLTPLLWLRLRLCTNTFFSTDMNLRTHPRLSLLLWNLSEIHLNYHISNRPLEKNLGQCEHSSGTLQIQGDKSEMQITGPESCPQCILSLDSLLASVLQEKQCPPRQLPTCQDLRESIFPFKVFPMAQW